LPPTFPSCFCYLLINLAVARYKTVLNAVSISQALLWGGCCQARAAEHEIIAVHQVLFPTPFTTSLNATTSSIDTPTPTSRG
jgi:hypothetical protein